MKQVERYRSNCFADPDVCLDIEVSITKLSEFLKVVFQIIVTNNIRKRRRFTYARSQNEILEVGAESDSHSDLHVGSE